MKHSRPICASFLRPSRSGNCRAFLITVLVFPYISRQGNIGGTGKADRSHLPFARRAHQPVPRTTLEGVMREMRRLAPTPGFDPHTLSVNLAPLVQSLRRRRTSSISDHTCWPIVSFFFSSPAQGLTDNRLGEVRSIGGGSRGKTGVARAAAIGAEGAAGGSQGRGLATGGVGSHVFGEICGGVE